jgi:hypothetical protein
MIGEPTDEEEVVFFEDPGIAAAWWILMFQKLKSESTPLRQD